MKYLFAILRNKRLHQFTPNRNSPCAFQNQIFSLKITMNNMNVIVGFVWQNWAEAQMYLILFIYLLFLGNEMKIDGDLRAELGVACELCQHQNALRSIIWSRFINNVTNISNVSQSFNIFWMKYFINRWPKTVRSAHPAPSSGRKIWYLNLKICNFFRLIEFNSSFMDWWCFKMSR